MLPQPFGNPHTYVGHSGVDYPQGQDTPVRASGSGVVTHAGWQNPRAAYAVLVQYDGGPLVLYCHFDGLGKLAVQKGDRVSAGTLLARVGRRGLNSTGYHLHMEIMSGKGAHTFAGIWNYFSRTAVVGQGGGAGKPTPAAPATTKKRKKDSTMLLYYTQDMNGELLFALAGASPGTPANWHETRDQDLANDWARQVGVEVAAKLSLTTFVQYSKDFRAPVRVASA